MKKKIPKTKVQKPKPELVIQFVGKRRTIDKKTGKIKLVLGEAPAQRRNGQRVFDLPSHDDQVKGFTHEAASELLALYPGEFKKKVTKGKK